MVMISATHYRTNPVRGPAKKPEWAQMIRLGGDRVAVLLDELRKAVGKVDGIVEKLHCSPTEACWIGLYRLGGAGLFTLRVLPGLPEASILLSRAEADYFLGTRKLSATIRDAIRNAAGGKGPILLRLPRRDRRLIGSVASLVTGKSRLASLSPRTASKAGGRLESEVL